MPNDLDGSNSNELRRSSARRRRPLHIVHFIAGLAIVPLAVWFFLEGDTRGGALTAIVALIAIAYGAVNLFVRPWP